jgi:ABC-type branched-subunit amino acid transport system substrate-binding protein
MGELIRILAARMDDDNGVDAILGPILSSITQPVSSAANSLEIPVLSHWSSSALLSNKRNYPYFARTTPTDESVALAMADLFVHFGYKRVGLLYSDEAYGNAWKNALFNACERERDIRLLTVLFDETESSVDNAVSSIKGEDVNVIVYIFISDSVLGYLAQAAKKHEMLDDKLWLSTINDLNVAEEEFPKQDEIREFLRGSIHIIVSVPGITPVGGTGNVINEKWESLLKTIPRVNATRITESFPKKTINGSTFTLPSDYFTNSELMISHAFAPWSWGYDAVIAYGLAACECASRGLTDSCTTDIKTPCGKELFQALIATNFVGVSGHVIFLPNGDRDPSTSHYIMKNARPNGRNGALINDPVGLWIPSTTQEGSGSWRLREGAIFYGSKGSKTPPPDSQIPFHDEQVLPDWAKIMGYVEASLILAGSLWSCFFVLVNRRHIVLVKSQPHFLLLLCLGCALMGSAIIPLTIENSTSCMTFPWLIGCGLTLALSALGAKSWRVYTLWNNPGFQFKKTKKGVFYVALICCLVLIEVGLLISWTAVAPLEYVRIISVTSDRGFPLVSYGICLGDYPASAVFLGLLVSLNAIVILGTIYSSYLVKNAPEEFQEAHSTFVAGCALCCVYFLGIPTVAALYANPVGRFLGLSSISFLTSTGLLLAMFLPRVRAVRRSIRTPLSSQARGSSLEPQQQQNQVQQTRNTPASARRPIPVMTSTKNLIPLPLPTGGFSARNNDASPEETPSPPLTSSPDVGLSAVEAFRDDNLPLPESPVPQSQRGSTKKTISQVMKLMRFTAPVTTPTATVAASRQQPKRDEQDSSGNDDMFRPQTSLLNNSEELRPIPSSFTLQNTGGVTSTQRNEELHLI